MTDHPYPRERIWGDCERELTSARAEIEQLRGLLREVINAQNWLFDTKAAENLDRRIAVKALGE